MLQLPATGECFSKVHDRHLPWEERAKLRGAQRRADPPSASTATGHVASAGHHTSVDNGMDAGLGASSSMVQAMKKPTLAAARKWAQKEQLQVCWVCCSRN